MGFPPVKQPLAFEAEALARRCPGKRGRKKDISRNVLPEDYVAPEERANQLAAKAIGRRLLGGRATVKI
ncbi:MAG: hypothetical protein DMG54_27675 [Acidobacteria bacterium]|nr:MAG: hypothetical protein DMG54_27675 [Acidobacteriota bacterium]PYU42487.1 MAG: hypothetical protein DMG53_19610 [Acidobacteriota bacterium]PYU74015.1 MAG: hypothetical protein DMG52_12585 [Acidobacteriota bacterium]